MRSSPEGKAWEFEYREQEATEKTERKPIGSLFAPLALVPFLSSAKPKAKPARRQRKTTNSFCYTLRLAGGCRGSRFPLFPPVEKRHNYKNDLSTR
jgi:hypothetical protein